MPGRLSRECGRHERPFRLFSGKDAFPRRTEKKQEKPLPTRLPPGKAKREEQKRGKEDRKRRKVPPSDAMRACLSSRRGRAMPATGSGGTPGSESRSFSRVARGKFSRIFVALLHRIGERGHTFLKRLGERYGQGMRKKDDPIAEHRQSDV